MPAKKSKASDESKTKRVQLEFAAEAYAKLVQVRERSGARTFSEVIRNALRLYDWYLELSKNKEHLQVASSDGKVREVQILF